MYEKLKKEFENMRFISNLSFNEKESQGIFCLHKMDFKENKYNHSLNIIDSNFNINEIKEISNSTKEKITNEAIYYVEKKDNKNIIKKYDLETKEIIDIYKTDIDLIDYSLIDNKLVIIYEKTYNKNENEYYEEINKTPFYSNGDGIVSNKTTCLQYINLKTNAIINKFEKNNIIWWFFDKEQLIFIVEDNSEIFSPFNSPYILDFNKNIIYNIYNKYDFMFNTVHKISDQYIVTGSFLKNYGINENPKIYTLDNNKLTLIYDNELSMENSVGSDLRYNCSELIKIYNNKFYFVSSNENGAFLYKLEQNKPVLVSDKLKSFDGYNFINDKIICYGTKDNKPQEIYLIENNQIKQISNFNTNYNYNNKIETIEYTISNGQTIKGFILYPKNYCETKKYPCILHIHGGPKTVYTDILNHEMQVLSDNGYFVIFTNPRGSDILDNKYADIRGRYGKEDYDDLMTFTNHILDNIQSIDKNRLGVCGGSYGGYMTNHITSHTQMFKVAVTQRSISNWVSFYSTSDIGSYFALDQNKLEKFDVEKLWDNSPLKYVQNVKATTLIIHSDQDYRCPLEQGIQWYTHLKINKVKTKLMIYKNQNHDLSRSGNPIQRLNRLYEIVKWFNLYL